MLVSRRLFAVFLTMTLLQVRKCLQGGLNLGGHLHRTHNKAHDTTHSSDGMSHFRDMMNSLAVTLHLPYDHIDDRLITTRTSSLRFMPRIIHQSWRTKRLEPFQQDWQNSWLDHHPEWTYMFWTDADNRKLIAQDFPWFLDVYDNFPLNIQRADCARYFYMLRFGGVYVDLDFESLKALDPLVQNVQVALGYMSTDTTSEIAIPNAFLASIPGHMFWWYVVKRVLTAFAAGQVNKNDAHRITGPVMLREAVAQYRASCQNNELVIFASETLYGIDFNWRDDPKKQQLFNVCHAASKEFNSTLCKSFFPNSYAITYWSGDITWMKPK